MRMFIWLNHKGFFIQNFHYHVCKLTKPLYGLKHARCTWIYKFSSYLQSLGSTYSWIDSSMFIFGPLLSWLFFCSMWMMLLLQVVLQRLFIISSAYCQGNFQWKSLGTFITFWGPSCTNSWWLFLSQSNYVRDLLTKLNLHKFKPVRTMLPSQAPLSSIDGELLAYAAKYRNIVGDL